MKKILLLCSLILIGCGSSVEPYEEFYDNGQLKIETSTKNDELNGEFIRYYEDGKIKETGTYVSGKKEGPAVYYFLYGDREEGTFVNGIEEGPAVYYYGDGRSASSYYGDGSTSVDINYVDGKNTLLFIGNHQVKDSFKKSSSYSSSLPGSSSGSQKGVYDLRKGEITFRIVVSGSGDILEYSGFSKVYGVQGNVSGTIKNNTLFEDGVVRIGTIDRNGKSIRYNGQTIFKR